MSVPSDTQTLVVRIRWELALTLPDGRPLWQGRIQHATSGQSHAFQSFDELLQFIQVHTGELGEPEADACDTE